MRSALSNVLAVTYVPIDNLLPYPRNARVHSKSQIRQISASIKAFGFTNPVLIDRSNSIVAGHGRVEAARVLGMDEVPTIRLETLTEQQVRSYVLADNRLAEKAGWDKAILAIELQHIILNTDIDVSVTGFEIPEIDLIIENLNQTKKNDDDIFTVNQTIPAISQLGDLWELGKHRLLCGNSLDESSFEILLGRRKANMVFLDPPYNCVVDGFASGNGRIHHREFVMASGEMNESEFISFLATAFKRLARHSTNESLHFICIDWRHMWEMLAAGKQIYDALLNCCVWVKDNGGMGSLYRSRHEFVLVFRNGKGWHLNNIQLGKFGRNRTNVWEYPSANTLSRQCDEGNLLALHPTVKPVSLVADAILDCSARGDIVLDSFSGSGSTLIAAERVGRVCMGIEIDPIYVDVAVRRWQRITGDRAVHSKTGKSFDDLAEGGDASHER